MTPAPRVLPLVLAFIFLSVASGNMVNVALPYLGADLGVPESTYAWVVTGFTLTFAVFSAVHGRLGDLLGTRRLYLAGALGFGLLALLSAMAPTAGTLIAVRVVHGAFAAAIPSLGTTTLARLLPPDRRGPAMGAVVATVGLAASISPFLGGLLVQVASWRLVFLMPAVGLLLLPVAARVLPKSLDETTPGRFDALGAALLAGAAAALLIATDLVHTRGLHGLTLAAGGLGFALALAFGAWSRRAPAPFAPPAVLFARRFQAIVLAAALANATRFGTLILVPIALEGLFHVAPLKVGLALFPGAILLAILSPLAGRLADRFGARRVAGGGLLGMVASCLLTAALMGHAVPGMAVGMAAYGVAFAFVQPPLLASLGGVVAREDTGIGNGLFLMLFFLGGAFGVAMSVTVVGLQPELAAGWLFDAPPGVGRFANATLSLTALLGLAIAVVPALPSR